MKLKQLLQHIGSINVVSVVNVDMDFVFRDQSVIDILRSERLCIYEDYAVDFFYVTESGLITIILKDKEVST